MFTDEKWWDIVGPAMYKYVKAGSKAEAKTKNKVCSFEVCLSDQTNMIDLFV